MPLTMDRNSLEFELGKCVSELVVSVCLNFNTGCWKLKRLSLEIVRLTDVFGFGNCDSNNSLSILLSLSLSRLLCVCFDYTFWAVQGIVNSFVRSLARSHSLARSLLHSLAISLTH